MIRIVHESKWARRVPIAAFTFLFLAHWIVIGLTAVNIPVNDEWDILAGKALSEGFPLSWMLALHNEHRVALTKLEYYLFYQLTDVNLVLVQLFNFAIYGVLLGTLIWISGKKARETTFSGAVCFTLFLLSTLNAENHFWGLQSCFHFTLLFFLAALPLLFSDSSRAWRVAAGVICLVLSMYSLASGLALAFVAWTGFTFLCLCGRSPDGPRFNHWLAGTLAMGAVAGAWLRGYASPQGHPALVFPDQARFWAHFFNIVSYGFGFQLVNAWLGLLCLIAVLLPVAVIAGRGLRARRIQTEHLLIVVAILGILTSLSVVSLGRAGMGVGSSKSSRYSELGMCLLPLAYAAWMIALRNRASLRNAAVLALWGLAFTGFANNWSPGYYVEHRTRRENGRECLIRGLAAGPPILCPLLHPSPMENYLAAARKLKLSFVKDLGAAGP